MKDYRTHLYTLTSEMPTLLYTRGLKKIPLSVGASPYIIGSTTRGLPLGIKAPFTVCLFKPSFYV